MTGQVSEAQIALRARSSRSHQRSTQPGRPSPRISWGEPSSRAESVAVSQRLVRRWGPDMTASRLGREEPRTQRSPDPKVEASHHRREPFSQRLGRVAGPHQGTLILQPLSPILTER